MGEKTPEFEHWNVASLARDIILHNADTYTDPENGRGYYRSEPWTIEIEEGTMDAVLFSNGLYSATSYTLDVSVLTESEIHRYIYSSTRGVFDYEHPIGEPRTAEFDQEAIGRHVEWILGHGFAPEAVTYDDEEKRRQRQFSTEAGYIAVNHLLESNLGRVLFRHLLETTDPDETNSLYGEFHKLIDTDDSPFKIGASTTAAVLQAMVKEARPRPRMLTRRPHNNR